jgi:hypothetical protein
VSLTSVRSVLLQLAKRPKDSANMNSINSGRKGIMVASYRWRPCIYRQGQPLSGRLAREMARREKRVRVLRDLLTKFTRRY